MNWARNVSWQNRPPWIERTVAVPFHSIGGAPGAIQDLPATSQLPTRSFSTA